MANWFCNRNGKSEGPLTSSQLKVMAEKGEIDGSTPVQREGSDRWVRADRITGLHFAKSITTAPEHGEVSEGNLKAGDLFNTVEAEIPTRRCPFCSELILASAIKCKHCQEFLSEPPLSTRSAPEDLTSITLGDQIDWAPLKEIAIRQQVFIGTILASFFLEVPLFLLTLVEPLFGFGAIGLLVVFRVAISIGLAVVAFRNAGVGVFMGLLTAVPFFGLIAMVSINGVATQVLRSMGIHVGFMGADARSIPPR